MVPILICSRQLLAGTTTAVSLRHDDRRWGAAGALSHATNFEETGR
jgi:hypothetical protein